MNKVTKVTAPRLFHGAGNMNKVTKVTGGAGQATEVNGICKNSADGATPLLA